MFLTINSQIHCGSVRFYRLRKWRPLLCGTFTFTSPLIPNGFCSSALFPQIWCNVENTTKSDTGRNSQGAWGLRLGWITVQGLSMMGQDWSAVTSIGQWIWWIQVTVHFNLCFLRVKAVQWQRNPSAAHINFLSHMWRWGRTATLMMNMHTQHQETSDVQIPSRIILGLATINTVTDKIM